MPKYLLHPLYMVAFATILILLVPRADIRRLSIHGIIFGGFMDVLVHSFGYVTGLFAWIEYGPFGFIGVHIFAHIAWSAFFIMYFYFLPKKNPLNYLFAGAGVFLSIIYYNLVLDLGIFIAKSRLIFPLLGFSLWFSIATWGFYKLQRFIEVKKIKRI